MTQAARRGARHARGPTNVAHEQRDAASDGCGAARARGLAPRVAVAMELARAAFDLALLAPRTLAYLARRERLRDELARDLAHSPRLHRVAPLPALPPRPLCIFLSCAEASGEIHARNLLRALRARIAAAGAPPPRVVGLGGAALRAEGVELLGAPAERAAMGFEGILGALPYYLRLVEASAVHFRDERPDLFLPVDSPALHVPLARIARRYAVPTVHFVAPQFWGWAPWRVRTYRGAVERALTILPFEPAWFERRGVAVAHVGHPLLDVELELDARSGALPLDERRDLVLLPGSRRAVLERNLPWMLEVVAAERARLGTEAHAGARIVVVAADADGAARAAHLIARSPAAGVELETGGLARALARARAAFSVSGTVLIDLLRQRVPAVVIYRVPDRRTVWMSRHLLTAPWFSSVNLLAGRELFPEFCFAGDGPRAAVGAALVRCYGDPGWRSACAAALEGAAARLGPPGACERAADAALAVAADGIARREGKARS